MSHPREIHSQYRFPEYHEAGRKFIGKFGHEVMLASSPLLSLVSMGNTDQLANSVFGPRADHEIESKWTQESEIKIDFADAREGNYWSLLEAFHAASQARAQDTEAKLLKMANDVTDYTGQVLRNPGRPLDYDIILDAIEGLTYRFDESDQPIMDGYAFVVHPDVARHIQTLPPPSPAHDERHQAIMKKKLEEYRANQRVRRLSHIP